MGMACGLESGNCSAEDLKVARSLVPKVLEPYVTGQRGVSSSWSSPPIAALPATPALLQTRLYSQPYPATPITTSYHGHVHNGPHDAYDHIYHAHHIPPQPIQPHPAMATTTSGHMTPTTTFHCVHDHNHFCHAYAHSHIPPHPPQPHFTVVMTTTISRHPIPTTSSCHSHNHIPPWPCPQPYSATWFLQLRPTVAMTTATSLRGYVHNHILPWPQMTKTTSGHMTPTNTSTVAMTTATSCHGYVHNHIPSCPWSTCNTTALDGAPDWGGWALSLTTNFPTAVPTQSVSQPRGCCETGPCL